MILTIDTLKNIEEAKNNNLVLVNANYELLQNEIERIEITSDKGLLAANEAVKHVKDFIKTSTLKRDELRKPVGDYYDQITNSYNINIKAAEKLEDTIKNKMLNYKKRIEEEEQKRKADEIKRLEEQKKTMERTAIKLAEQDTDMAKDLVETVEEVKNQITATQNKEISQIKSVTSINARSSYVKRWTYEVTNENEIPRVYCSPDRGKMRDAVNSGVREIPGLRIYEEESIKVR